MGQLQQAASVLAAGDIASDQLRRHPAFRGHLHRGFEKRALKKLIAKIYHRRQLSAAANAAAAFMKNVH